ncbi:hypothetical protein [Halorhabdus sp. BNX81]|uniref:hypothetical protein n=1 Tax=Halorhabdus sp. BNX81 TaxID=2980181 RepID=UPI0023DD1BF7|nr:hypothetical protein [Halorhabdus sp. BNX81]
MNRRRLLALAGTSAGGLAVTAVATNDAWRSFGGQLRVGLAPVVPTDYRAAARRRVIDQLENALPLLMNVRVGRAHNEYRLLRGLADGDYDVVELGAVAGTAALEAELVDPLVWPSLGGTDHGMTYDVRIVTRNPDLDRLPEDRWIAVGDPLSTPAHAALASVGNLRVPPTRVRWHTAPSGEALDNERVALAATDEFRAPSSLSIYRSTPVSVPALYVRRGVGNVSRLRAQFGALRGNSTWYETAKTPAEVPSKEWRGDAPEWVGELHLPGIQ